MQYRKYGIKYCVYAEGVLGGALRLVAWEEDGRGTVDGITDADGELLIAKGLDDGAEI